MHEQHARYEKGHIDMDTRPTKATRIKVASAGVAMVGALAIALASAGPAAGHGWEAKAVLRDVKGARVGTVRFEGNDDGTKVKVVVHGITVGLDDFHGLHIHANEPRGTCTPPFTDAGGHWNPGGATHGHHAGDLPSLLVQADRTGRATTVTRRFDPDDIKGKAVILHAGPDNFANIPVRYGIGTPPVPGPDAATLATGDSGERIACGIIRLD